MKITTINHEARKELGLNLTQYCIADSVYHLSNNPKAKKQGWCNANKQYLAEYFGISRQAVHTIINKLVAEDLLLRDSNNSQLLKTTERWYQVVIEWKEYCKETLHSTVNKLDTNCKESLHGTVNKLDTKCKETLHPSNKENNNKDIDSDKSLSVDFLKSREQQIIDDMTAQQMALDDIGMKAHVKPERLYSLIQPWANHNRATGFENKRHMINSFRKYVQQHKLEVSQGGGGVATTPMLRPGERRRVS